MKSCLPPAVEADLARQAAELDKRVRGPSLYAHEVHEFELARHANRRVALELDLLDELARLAGHRDASALTDEFNNGPVRRVTEHRPAVGAP